MIRKILPLFLIACLIFLCGCTQTAPIPPPQVTTSPSPMPSPVTPGISSLPETTMVPGTVPTLTNVTVSLTPAATAEPVDVSGIRFTRYSDADFSMDYPETWNVSRSTYTSTICRSTEDYRCYRNEIKTIGPFNFTENPALKKPSRIVTFTSPDGTLKVVAFISDFRDNLVGLYQINPDIGWAMNRVHAIFPDVSGLAAVGDYRYDRSANAMTFRYTVILPELSEDYPLAYASENFLTVHRDFEFVFMTDNENFVKYRNLRERILSSITPNDIV